MTHQGSNHTSTPSPLSASYLPLNFFLNFFFNTHTHLPPHTHLPCPPPPPQHIFPTLRRVPRLDCTAGHIPDSPPAPVEGGPTSDPAPPSLLSGDLLLSALTFAYPSRPKAPVLAGFSLRILGGKMTALVRAGVARAGVQRYEGWRAGVQRSDGWLDLIF